jgi:hypothetical protein
MRPQRQSRVAVFALSVLTFSGFAIGMADSASAYSDRVRRACKGDYHRLCPSYKLDSPQLRTCMESNGFLISGPCIDALVDSGEVDGARVRKRR